MYRNWILMITLFAVAPPGAAGERFIGIGKLTEPAARTGARFRLQAELTQRPAGSVEKSESELGSNSPLRKSEMNNGRFGLTASFTDSVAGAVCGLELPLIFANGFEN